MVSAPGLAAGARSRYPDARMRLADLMENTLAYRLWQAPFADSKLRPFLEHADLTGAQRVLDVGCGPGTNAAYFKDVDYTGLDINEGYIADAKARYGRDFRVADVTKIDPAALKPADIILVNSLLHHLDDAETDRTLGSLTRLLAPGGSVHILDLVLPDHWSMARVLAKLDRGHFPRPVEAWRRIFGSHFQERVFEPYFFGGRLWSMVYFRGVARE
jgi:SAM-dependent methyltransferase